jgi:hypothetical protein
MPISGSGREFDSSRVLAYKDYLLKYMRILDETGGINSVQALDRMMREVERDFPNDKVHPGDIIIAACDLAWKYGQAARRPATGMVQEIVANWNGTGHHSMKRTDSGDDPLKRAGFVLPGRLRN